MCRCNHRDIYNKNFLAVELLENPPTKAKENLKELQKTLQEMAQKDIISEERAKMRPKLIEIRGEVEGFYREKEKLETECEVLRFEASVHKKSLRESRESVVSESEYERERLLNEIEKLKAEAKIFGTEYRENIMKKVEVERDIAAQEIMKYRVEANGIRNIISELINRRNDLARAVREKEMLGV
jgi:hypothetical protein